MTSKPPTESPWVLAFLEGRVMLGRVVTGGLEECYELVTIRQMTERGMNVQIQLVPIIGLTGNVKIRLPFDCPLLYVRDLEEHDQAYILSMLDQCVQGIRQIRASRAGIVMADSVEIRKH